ncbi:hypothetical protein [Streptomyces anulatus]|uniref:hypothetical protein n=1 Tax=Streptomyces anulatus TaxID=1892 RepID=UPI0036B3C807
MFLGLVQPPETPQGPAPVALQQRPGPGHIGRTLVVGPDAVEDGVRLVEAVVRVGEAPLPQSQQPQELDGGSQTAGVPRRPLVASGRRRFRTGLILGLPGERGGRPAPSADGPGCWCGNERNTPKEYA